MEEQPVEAANGHISVDMEDAGFVIPAENAEHNTDDETLEEARSKTSDASYHESLLSPPRSSSRSHEFDSKRKFRIMGLKHPGDWRKHEKLQDMLARCEQLHIWFDPNPTKGVKTGGVSLTFDCPEAARVAFAEAQKFVLDGVPVKLQASRSFYEQPRRPLHSFSISEDPDVRERTLYAVYLLESTSATVLETIFVDLEKVEILQLAENRKQAEVLMKTKEAAEAAKEDADGFPLNDGENSSVIKVFNPSEYMDFISRGCRAPLLSPTLSTSSLVPPISRSNSNASSTSKPTVSPVKTHHKEKPVKPARAPPSALPAEIPEFEPARDEVAASITSIVDEERVNWAEMELSCAREELYALADKASYKLGGVRDELLRESLLSVMEAARATAAAEQSSWMRRHLDELIKLWKKEMASGVVFDRPSRVPLQSRVINPLPKEKKRKRGGGAALRAQFGMGAVLAAARAKFATEEGELDIEEADDGSILIGDVPLSFESWARFNKQPLKRAAPKEDKSASGSVDNSKENRRVKRAKMEEEKKKRKDEEKAKKESEKPQKELEEGEMDSDDSEGEKKSASSSSSSSDSDEDGDSRRRRRFRRKNDRTKPPSLPPLFQSIYDNRVAIINQLSVEHRVAFSNVLTQFVNQKGGIDSNQQKALMSYMSSFR